jgi:hypothetical protein
VISRPCAKAFDPGIIRPVKAIRKKAINAFINSQRLKQADIRRVCILV